MLRAEPNPSLKETVMPKASRPSGKDRGNYVNKGMEPSTATNPPPSSFAAERSGRGYVSPLERDEERETPPTRSGKTGRVSRSSGYPKDD
jgi:hypothetical protein